MEVANSKHQITVCETCFARNVYLSQIIRDKKKAIEYMDEILVAKDRIWHSEQIEILNHILHPYSDSIEAYVCGGFIRDHIGKMQPSKDIDLFVDADKPVLGKLLQHLARFGRIDYGQYGSPRLYLDLCPSIAYIDIVPFDHFIVTGERIIDINQLLRGFDITANALGLDIKTGAFYNPVNGVSDIKNRVLRAVRLDFPELNISSSISLSAVTVFWFRLLHYQAVLGYTIDDKTKRWISDNAWRMRDRDLFERYFFPVCISDDVKKIIM